MGLFDKAFFDNMKSGSIFISVGRGASTVTDALVAALQSGKLYGAGLDVTDPRPAIQPGRRIFTVKGTAAGLAVMSSDAAPVRW